MKIDIRPYSDLLNEIKTRIRQAQIKATLSANAEMILMYWDVGGMILDRQQKEGWGSAVIPGISRDIRNELPEEKGFSKRNIGYMIRLAREYGSSSILQQPVAKLETEENQGLIKVPQPVAKIPWGHNILLMEKVKDLSNRLWYMQQIIEQGLSRDALGLMIKNNAHNLKSVLPTIEEIEAELQGEIGEDTDES